LEHLEKDREVSIGTRNCRLAAIHSFFTFVSARDPLAIAQCNEIARIPVKKMPRPAMSYLDSEEIAAILRQPNRSSLEGQRDHALLAFPLQNGSPNPGGAGCVSAGYPVRITRSGRIARERA
jgi:site-specific recombinase XerD